MCSKVPHPVFDMEEGEVCLIVKEKHEEYREMARAGKLPPQVKKVLDLKKLRTVYHQFEARRKLANSYDLFLVDKFVRDQAMPLLGVEFFRRKKTPVAINAQKNGVAKRIDKAIRRCTYVRRDVGTTVTCKAAPTALDDAAVVDNVLTVATALAALPGIGWPNVKAMYLRTNHSPSLPLFVAATPTAVPERKGEARSLEKLRADDARGRELAKGADADEAEDFRLLERALGHRDFARVMRNMARMERRVQQHPKLLSRRRRVRVTDEDDSDSELEGDEQEPAPAPEPARVRPRKEKRAAPAPADAAEPAAKKPKTGKETKETPAPAAPAPAPEPEPEHEPEPEPQPEPEPVKEAAPEPAPEPAPARTPRKRAAPKTPGTAVKTRAAAKKELEELRQMASRISVKTPMKSPKKTPKKTPAKTPAKSAAK